MSRVVSPRLRRCVDRVTVVTLLAADLLIALVWLVGGERRVTAPAYGIALERFPIETYGAVLLLLTCGVFVFHALTRDATSLAWAGLGAYWVWWAVATALYAMRNGDASGYFPATAAVLAVVHVGTALTREA